MGKKMMDKPAQKLIIQSCREKMRKKRWPGIRTDGPIILGCKMSWHLING